MIWKAFPDPLLSEKKQEQSRAAYILYFDFY